mmetsp:Transcript_15934/g.17691  ORF Transcript_15934/g.17691 Transcript_15934/m.17691 type:complete len:228 (-) Transcript_15934:28-711(-)
MGCLQSILGSIFGSGGAEDGSNKGNDGDVELQLVPPVVLNPSSKGPNLILTNNNSTCSGTGTIIADTAIEQDSAYWEAKIISSEGHFCLGVARKQDELNKIDFPNNESTWGFSTISDNNDSETTKKEEEEKWGFEEIDTTLKFQDGDVVGIVMDYTDLPMLSFYKNGELMDDFSVWRIRGKVYPAVRIIEEDNNATKIEMVFGPSDKWKYPPPKKRCTQIVKSQNVI